MPFIPFSAINDSLLSIQCTIYVTPVVSMHRMWTRTIIPGSCATLHFQPCCCLPLVSTCICLFNEGRRLLASGLLNGHLFFMPVSLHPSTLRPHSPLQAASQATGHMTSARMKSDRRPGKRRAKLVELVEQTMTMPPKIIWEFYSN